MPTYRFQDQDTGEIFEKWMYMRDREKYLEENPNVKQLPTALNSVSGTGMGTKQDGGFKEVMSKVQSAHPRANLSRFT